MIWYENYQELKEKSQKKNKEAKLFKQKKVQSDPMITAMSDMENYIRKMGEYMNYMKELEEKNARLEHENLRYRAENESLKGQLINVTPQFPIQEKIRMQMTNNHQ